MMPCNYAGILATVALKIPGFSHHSESVSDLPGTTS
jgi:hypothetical protein